MRINSHDANTSLDLGNANRVKSLKAFFSECNRRFSSDSACRTRNIVLVVAVDVVVVVVVVVVAISSVFLETVDNTETAVRVIPPGIPISAPVEDTGVVTAYVSNTAKSTGSNNG